MPQEIAGTQILNFFNPPLVPLSFTLLYTGSCHPLGFISSLLIGKMMIESHPKTLMKPKRTILCADGNEQSLSIRKVMLETRGYRVLAYSNSEAAFQRFKEGGVDLVLADLVMPGFDGTRLIEQIKNVSPETPAILLSAKVRSYDHETRADIFLPKGMYGPADLLDRIRTLLIRKRGPKRTHSPLPMAGASTAA